MPLRLTTLFLRKLKKDIYSPENLIRHLSEAVKFVRGLKSSQKLFFLSIPTDFSVFMDFFIIYLKCVCLCLASDYEKKNSEIKKVLQEIVIHNLLFSHIYQWFELSNISCKKCFSFFSLHS